MVGKERMEPDLKSIAPLAVWCLRYTELNMPTHCCLAWCSSTSKLKALSFPKGVLYQECFCLNGAGALSNGCFCTKKVLCPRGVFFPQKVCFVHKRVFLFKGWYWCVFRKGGVLSTRGCFCPKDGLFFPKGCFVHHGAFLSKGWCVFCKGGVLSIRGWFCPKDGVCFAKGVFCP